MSTSGARINADKFEQMIHRRGRIVKWQEATMCSCWSFDSGQPNYGCNSCKGTGYTYEEPIEDIVLFMSVTHNKAFDDMAGVFEVGDAVMTVGRHIPEILPNGRIDATMKNARKNPIFNVGMYDLITLLDDDYKTSEILVKSTPMYGRAPDTLLNSDVVEVRSVRKSNPETGEITDYKLGTDFSLEGAEVVWLGTENEPSEGEQYTVTYTHRPVFTVLTNLPTPRYQDGQDLPKKVALRYRAGGFDRK